MGKYVSADQIADYQRDGVVYIKGLFKDWVPVISEGIERNMREPGQYAAENLKPGESGRFFDDYCNWERIPEFTEIIRKSPAAQAAAELMQSKTAQIFHDHVLVKEPGTSKPTPWHQDAPYYFVDGDQTVGVTVEGDADVGPLGSHHGAQTARIRGPAAGVDVAAVGTGVDDHHLRARALEHIGDDM